MTSEAQIWKDRFYALKKWVEDNVPENQKDTNREYNSAEAAYYDARAQLDLTQDISFGSSDYWESREK